MTFAKSSPFEHAHAEWNQMVDALTESEYRAKNSDQLNIQLMARIEMVESELESANAQCKFWMAYSVQIETRLDVISGVIQDARNEARAHAKAYNGTLHRERAEPPPAPPNPTPAAPQPTSRDRRPSLADVARQQRQPEQSDDDGAVEIVETIHKLANKWP